MYPFLDQLPDIDAQITVAVHVLKQIIFKKALRRTRVTSRVFKDVWRYYCGQVVGMFTSYPENGVMDADMASMKEALKEEHGAEDCDCILCTLSRDIQEAIDRRKASERQEKPAN